MIGIIKCAAPSCQSTNVVPFGTGSITYSKEDGSKATYDGHTSYYCRDCGCYFPIVSKIITPLIEDVPVEDKHKE